MIRRPARGRRTAVRAACRAPASGSTSVIAEHAAAAPGVLPLLSFTLEALYAEDVDKRGGHVLTFATYDGLGGLEGAIATRADDTLARLPATAQAALPRVLRALATVSLASDQLAVSRAAPLNSFAPGSPARVTLDALIGARLVVASREGTAPVVRLAHEALLSRWERARLQMAADRRDLETRMLVESQQTRHAAAAQRARKAAIAAARSRFGRCRRPRETLGRRLARPDSRLHRRVRARRPGRCASALDGGRGGDVMPRQFRRGFVHGALHRKEPGRRGADRAIALSRPRFTQRNRGGQQHARQHTGSRSAAPAPCRSLAALRQQCRIRARGSLRQPAPRGVVARSHGAAGGRRILARRQANRDCRRRQHRANLGRPAAARSSPFSRDIRTGCGRRASRPTARAW